MNKYYKLNDHKLLAFETRGNLDDDNFALFVHQYYVDNIENFVSGSPAKTDSGCTLAFTQYEAYALIVIMGEFMREKGNDLFTQENKKLIDELNKLSEEEAITEMNSNEIIEDVKNWLNTENNTDEINNE